MAPRSLGFHSNVITPAAFSAPDIDLDEIPL